MSSKITWFYLATSMAFGLQSEATAQVLWEIDNLPDALLGKIEISKDMDSYNAANSLVHILENSGYPLATVFIKNDLLIVNLGPCQCNAVSRLRQAEKRHCRATCNTPAGSRKRWPIAGCTSHSDE